MNYILTYKHMYQDSVSDYHKQDLGQVQHYQVCNKALILVIQ